MSGPPSDPESWRHPSATHRQKYRLVELPDDFVPTEEERLLLDMFKTVQNLERHAAKLKEEAARAKLMAAEEAFNKKMKPKRPPRGPGESRPTVGGEALETKTGREEDRGDAEMYHDDDEQAKLSDRTEKAGLRERSEAKLAALRAEVLEVQRRKQTEDDDLRQKLLQEQEPVLDGPSLKRKRIDISQEPTKSLITNLRSSVTPPHEFSKRLNLSVTQGRVLFPAASDLPKWSPPPDAATPGDRAFSVRLPDFDMAQAQGGQGNNTLVLRFTAPADAKRFSLNVTTPNEAADPENILFHFNPRQFERGGQLVLNDKRDGIWGQALALPLSQVPLLFGQPAVTLLVQVTAEGFDVFLGGGSDPSSGGGGGGDGLTHVARWQHRREVLPGDLVLQFPSTDDYGAPEHWTVYRVWWGNQPLRAKENAQVAGVNAYSSAHPRKLFVSGLSKVLSDAEVDLRRAELERAFRRFGGDRGVSVVVPTNATYAFVEMESERQADLALSEMSSQYRLNRARRSRHEALQEERAAKEAAQQVAEGSGWD